MSIEVNRMGIVGTGVMGAGIAQIAAQAGLEVHLFDKREGAASAARDGLQATFDKLVNKGKVSRASADAALSRLKVVNAMAELADCDVVVEAVIEDLSVKQNLFTELEAIVSENCILATNTSSLSVTAIASVLKLPGRVSGFHFFNPVPLMKVVEVIGGIDTSEAILDILLELANRLGHTGVHAKDTPGFIVNHAGRAYGTEGLKILEESVAAPADIDRILREGAGFRMGPLELFDLTGLDVSHPAMESIFTQFYHDPRYRPSYISRQMLNGNRLGRKTGVGFYRYEGGQKAEASVSLPVPEVRDVPPIWVGCEDTSLREEVVKLLEALGGRVESLDSPSEKALCLLLPFGDDAVSASKHFGVDPERTLCLDALLGFERHRTLMMTPVTCEEMRDAAHALLASDGIGVTVIRDSVGFVSQRVLAAVVNLACEIAQHEIATPTDIDNAVRLGLNYPHGPLAWGDELGPKRLLAILERMKERTGDPRYRPSPWLRRRATLGVSLLHQEPCIR
ncbi:3-hydroxyacyl-CoA dehydrogenase [Halomonas coralii]|uniref:3-hydroxyacyl-CoA dehydrogenase n=1 Tax=Modicisalibacter sp. R2A 31.J TaxID=2831898 RepID=UPI001CCB11DB|nr:3-hydroxyacyl-CoA dehydrogenase [Modicisalibacter sp. R2A 31.J]MBZ9557316.1 3-hydroxyacyl-CoA dehydrogenase [Modicisalibacter sp. R2A 31.J]